MCWVALLRWQPSELRLMTLGLCLWYIEGRQNSLWKHHTDRHISSNLLFDDLSSFAIPRVQSIVCSTGQKVTLHRNVCVRNERQSDEHIAIRTLRSTTQWPAVQTAAMGSHTAFTGFYFGVFLRVDMYPPPKVGIRHSVNTECTHTTGTNFDREGTE